MTNSSTLVTIRPPRLDDKDVFLKAMTQSQSLHHPWVSPPLTSQAFDDYIQRTQQENQQSYLVLDDEDELIGVFNLNEIVRGVFQNAFLGFYGVTSYAQQGLMSKGLKLVLKQAFEVLGLHRIEANIQPDNTRSLCFIQKNGFRYEGFSPRYLKIDGAWRGHEHWVMTSEDYLLNDPMTTQKDAVDIVSYDSSWPALALHEIDKIKSHFPDHKILDIQHVGSTAIPDLSAKPILDIQIAVASLDEMKILAVPLLQKLGYEYWDNNPDPTRMFFVKGMPPFGEKRTHHVHIFEQNSEHWRKKLIFRDYLRAHPLLATEYEALKIKLSREHTFDREKYTNEKLAFVNKVIRLSEHT